MFFIRQDCIENRTKINTKSGFQIGKRIIQNILKKKKKSEWRDSNRGLVGMYAANYRARKEKHILHGLMSLNYLLSKKFMHLLHSGLNF